MTKNKNSQGNNTAKNTMDNLNNENKDDINDNNNDNNIDLEQLKDLDQFKEIFDMNSILNNVFKKGNFNKNQNQNLNNNNDLNLENKNDIKIEENENIMKDEFNFENYENNNNDNNENLEGNDFNTGYVSNNHKDKITKGKKKENNTLNNINKEENKDESKEINYEEDDNMKNEINTNNQNNIKVIEDLLEKNNKENKNNEEEIIDENNKNNEDLNMTISENNENKNEEGNKISNKENNNYYLPEQTENIIDSKYIINTNDNLNNNNENIDLMDIEEINNLNEQSKNYFNDYLNNENSKESLNILKQFYNSLLSSSQNQIIKLTSLLKTILTPNIQSKLTGNYKTGKRLNMKKIISFIASNYRQDKIWLRRTLPFNRDYYITISIDNSLSMKFNNIGYYAIQTLIILVNSLQKVGIDNLNINSITDDCLNLYDYNKEKILLNSEKLIDIIKNFKFNFASNNSLDYSMMNFLIKNIKNIENATANSNKLKYNINFIISDGRMNKENVKGLTALAKEKGILYVFIIIDRYKFEDNNSILKSQSVSFDENGEMKIQNYLEDFPFQYYTIVQDIEDLPEVVKGILVKWMENIN